MAILNLEARVFGVDVQGVEGVSSYLVEPWSSSGLSSVLRIVGIMKDWHRVLRHVGTLGWSYDAH